MYSIVNFTFCLNLSLTFCTMNAFSKEDSESDDDVEKDGCVSSKVKKPSSIKITHDRSTPAMVLTSLPSPVAKGECIMLQEKGSVDVIVSKSPLRIFNDTRFVMLHGHFRTTAITFRCMLQTNGFHKSLHNIIISCPI